MIDFTPDELTHLKMLMGKDIGWQRKYNTGKEQLARDIYGKVVKEMQAVPPHRADAFFIW